jgi:hypothetical protein
MPRTSKPTLSADEIAEKASRGENISGYFTNKFTVVKPIRRVNVGPPGVPCVALLVGSSHSYHAL